MASPCTAWGCLPTSLCTAKHDHLITGGALGGNAVRLLECFPEEVAMFDLPWGMCTVLWVHVCTALATLVGSLGLTVPTLPP
jgi:hypothetical protein